MSKAVIKDFSWFDINNYAFINDLTINEFIKELEWRHSLFYCYDDEKSLDEQSFEDSIKYIRIFRGDPHLDVYSEEEIAFNNEFDEYMITSGKAEALKRDKPMLSHDIGVMPISFAELSIYSKIAHEKGAFSLNSEGDYSVFNPHYMLASVSGNVPDYLNHKVLLDLWLEEATDEEILSSLRKLLPKWRVKLNVPEPDILPKRRVGIKTLQKLISHRVIPMLDVILWGIINNKDISNPMLSHLIFPDDPKDSQAIKETIKPFSMESMTEPYTRLLRLFVDKDGEVGSAKVSDIISRIS